MLIEYPEDSEIAHKRGFELRGLTYLDLVKCVISRIAPADPALSR